MFTLPSTRLFFYMPRDCLLSFMLALVSFGAHLSILSSGHLHEDAYILFEYVKNFSSGHGIVYFEGGGKAEGATDFLWFIILSIFAKFGADVAVSAAFLNSIGVGFIGYFVLKVADFSHSIPSLFMAVAVTALVALSPINAVSLGGFSTAMYTAISILLLYLYWTRKEKNFVLIPVVAIMLGLFRPDGVLIGAGFCVLALYDLRESPYLKPYLFSSLVCVAVGLAYFAWRYSYFGNLLPLPLYVKVLSGGGESGWYANLNWLDQKYNHILLLVIFFSSLVNFKGERLHIFKSSLPYLFFFLALGLSHQSQNIAFRFQAPILAFFILLFVRFVRDLVEKHKFRGHLWFSFLLVLVLANAFEKRFTKEYVYLKNSDYINTFPVYLSEFVDYEVSIALTEAGRMAFWTDAKTYDLIGLNTVYTAKNKVDLDYLKSIKPDLIFLHTAGTLDIDSSRSGNWFVESNVYLQRNIKEKYAGDHSEVNDPVIIAPLVVYDYINKSPEEWKLFWVRYWGVFSHFYALRVGSNIDEENFIEALDKSFSDDNYLSYFSSVDEKQQLGFNLLRSR